MIFIETIYHRLIEETAYITTDDYSVDWLNQSRAYYSGYKTRKLEATIPVLKELLKTLERKRIAATNAAKQNDSNRLKYVANIYLTLSDTVADEITNSILKEVLKENDPNIKDLLLQAIDSTVQKEIKPFNQD